MSAIFVLVGSTWYMMRSYRRRKTALIDAKQTKIQIAPVNDGTQPVEPTPSDHANIEAQS